MRRFFNNSHFTFLALLCVAWVFLGLLNPFPSLKNRSIDTLFRETSPSGDVVLVKIDDKSIDKLGQWPWPRSVFASFLEHLGSASVVGLDISFREPSRLGALDDDAFETALARDAVPVVLPLHFEEGEIAYPLESFSSHVYSGFSSLPVDADGVVRRIFEAQGEVQSFSYVVASLVGEEEGRKFRAKPDRMYRIYFHGRNTTYPEVSFIDVLENKAPESLFNGHIVLVGVTASGLGTFLNTPFGLMSALEIHANAVDTFNEGIRYTSSLVLDVALIVLMTLLSGLASLYARRIFHIVGIVAGVLVSYWIGVTILFENFIIIDPLYPSLAALGTVFAATAYQFVTVLQREQTLRRSYDTLNSMVASMTDGVVMVDRERRVVAHNPEALRVLGHALPTAPLFSNIVQVLKNHIDVEEAVQTSVKEGRMSSFREVRIADRFFQVIVAPVSSRTVLGGVVILFHDVTSEKEVERVREDFTSMLVHELRSPLDVMRKMANVLISPPDSFGEERRSQYLSHIDSNASHILDLVNDLLDVAKLEAGKFELHKEGADIRAIVADRIAFYTPLAEGISLEHHVDEAVPQKFTIDPGRITQTLNNLISNAIKFTPPGEHVVVHISLCTELRLPEKNDRHTSIHWFLHGAEENSKGSIMVEVFNGGSQIPAEDIPRLFDKFKQFEAAARSVKKGTGLGLTIVRGIVEEHGGVVGAASGAGGTSFFFTLPALGEKKERGD